MLRVVCLILLGGIAAPACALSAPDEKTSQANLKAGIQAIAAEDYRTAVTELERAIVADPKNPDGYFRLAQTHRRLGNYRQALKYARLTLEIEPNHRPALLEQGHAQLDVGELEDAGETLEQLGARCDFSCDEYRALQRAVDAFKSKQDS